jgi:hypothetical protein
MATGRLTAKEKQEEKQRLRMPGDGGPCSRSLPWGGHNHAPGAANGGDIAARSPELSKPQILSSLYAKAFPHDVLLVASFT